MAKTNLNIDLKSFEARCNDRMAMIFDEWAKRYAESPEDFENCLDENGNPIEGYGKQATKYFNDIANDMDSKGLLPLPKL